MNEIQTTADITKAGKSNSAEDMQSVSKKIREIFGFKQHELALLLSTSVVTVSAWETKGVAPVANKVTPFGNLVQFIALVKQSVEHPEFVSLRKLKAYAKSTVTGELYRHYAQYSTYMSSDFAIVFKTPNLYTLLFALAFDKHLEAIGVPTPERNILSTGEISASQGGFSSDDILSMVDVIEKAADDGAGAGKNEGRNKRGRPPLA